MGDLGILIIGVVDTFFAFFVVAPMMLQAASLFGVQKQFAKAMVQEGVVKQEDVDRIHPKKQIAELAARGVKGFLSAELNAGQMVEDVRLAVNGLAPVEHYGRQGGMMFNPDEVLDALKEKLIKK